MNNHIHPQSRKRKNPEASNRRNDSDYYLSNKNTYCPNFELDKKSNVTAISSENNENAKHRKMGIIKITQCYSVLKALISHSLGWIFDRPVDPIALNIPDYFNIISNPMDLGTVKDRLERKYYVSSDEFAADVKLTFSNAMRYNPPGNFVHEAAKDLDKLFSTKWKALEAKQKKECQIPSQQKSNRNSNQVLPKAPPCNSYSSSNKILTSSEKVNLQSTLEKYSRRNCPQQLLNFLQKVGVHCHSEKRISINMDSVDDETLWELHQIVKGVGKAGPRKAAESLKGLPRLSKECNKGMKGTNVIRLTTRSKGSMASTITDDCTKSSQSCFNTDITFSHKSNIERSLSDDSIKSSARCSVTNYSTKATLDHYPNSKENSRNDSTCTAIVDDVPHSPVSCVQGTDYACEVHAQLSPTKALRAAMLKSRFADTILKAMQKTYQNNDARCDPEQMRREKEKLKKQQQEEKQKIEAEIKAAETAAEMKAKAKQLRREKERQEARLALEKMERTADFFEGSIYSKELANLAYPEKQVNEYMVAKFMFFSGKQSPLAKLGFLIKDDKEDDEFDGCADIEDGEII